MMDVLSPATPADPPGSLSFTPGMTRREQAAALGVSVRTWYRMLAAERAGTAGWLEPPAPPGPEPERPGPEGLPYVPLVEAHAPGLHYRLDADEESVLPDCPFRIGTGRGRWWRVAHKDDKYTNPKKPKACGHKFRPNGIGRKKNRGKVA